jgi:hypothetical protein
MPVIEERNRENREKDHLKFRGKSPSGYLNAANAPLGFPLMKGYLLHLTARQLTVRCATASAAYRWLDDHGRFGEPDKLGYADEDAGTVTVIDVGTYTSPDPRPIH